MTGSQLDGMDDGPHEIPGMPPCTCFTCAARRARIEREKTAQAARIERGRAAAKAEADAYQERLDRAAMALDGGHLALPGVTGEPPTGTGWNLVPLREAAPGVWVPDPVNGTHVMHGLPLGAGAGAGTELTAEVREPEPPAADPADAWWEVTRPLPRRLTWPQLTARVPDQPAGMCVTCRLLPVPPGQAKCGDCAELPDELPARAGDGIRTIITDKARPAAKARARVMPRIRLGPGLGPRVAVLGAGWVLIVIGAHVFLPLSLLGLLLVVMAVVRE